jgi:hypothetical protein
MKIIFIIITFTISGCTLPYKPFGSYSPYSTGYYSEKISDSEYSIKYSGEEKSDFKKLRMYLFKYASELCRKNISITNYKEETLVVHITAHGSGKKINRYVSAKLRCT